MRLEHLQVERFRGIRSLDWHPSGGYVCLVGPGDSMKSTILAAIEWALSPRWTLSPSDSDFYRLEIDDPITITATVTDLPAELVECWGLYLTAWDDHRLVEPRAGDPPMVTVRVRVDRTLEPTWKVVRGSGEEQDIKASDRAAFGMTRLGEDADRHLAWGRDSALTRLTATGGDVAQVMTNAHRAAKEAVDAAPLADLEAAADKARDASVALGSGRDGPFKPALLDGGLRGGQSAIGLHEDGVSLRSLGLGSRRLVALGVQLESFTRSGIALIDEIESGLEPHRLRHLIRELRPTGQQGQVIMTTHSSVTVVELACTEISVVRTDGDGIVTLKPVDAGLQALVRTSPEGLLARRVVVVEGATELGVLRVLRDRWASQHDDTSIAHRGVAIVNGGGDSKATAAAVAFQALGYDTALLVDSDTTPTPTVGDVATAGATVFAWDGAMGIEERVTLDLPWDSVVRLVDIADGDKPGARDLLRADLAQPPGTGPDDWLAAVTEAAIRSAVGRRAEGGRWFKTIESGEALGAVIADALASIPATDLATKLTALEDWAYAD